MQIRLYVDEDATTRAVMHGLRARGLDVTTVYDAEMSEQDDEAQLEYAAGQGRVLYTFNVGHFYQLHSEYLAQGKHHAGIILVYRQRYSIGEQIRRLLKVSNTKSAEEMKNGIHFL